MNESSEIQAWQSIYINSFQKIRKLIHNIDGIAVGLNTNVDVIIQITPEILQKLIQKLNISQKELEHKIKDWKGKIETFEDYLVGITGCFSQGKASEWIIRKEEAYNELLANLPQEKSYQMGGQAGIMANVLESQGVPKIFVHSITMPEKLRNLFNQSERIILPSVFGDKLEFHSPKSIFAQDDKLYLHIISEFDQDDKITFNDGNEWCCPRDNRFIATFDPLNAKMEISKGFRFGVKDIAKQSNGIIIAGFHMLDDDLISPMTIEEKIIDIINFLKTIKKTNPDIIIQLEQSSTKNINVLEKLVHLSIRERIWDSLSCNEREIAELLDIINEKELARKIRITSDQDSILKGCKRIFKVFSLKRLHLHQYGCYIVITSKDSALSSEEIRGSLCYASIITSFKARGLDISDNLIKNESIESMIQKIKLSTQYLQLKNILIQLSMPEPFLGIYEDEEIRIIIIPTILVPKPKVTVGLGDTISSSALIAELAQMKEKRKK